MTFEKEIVLKQIDDLVNEYEVAIKSNGMSMSQLRNMSRSQKNQIETDKTALNIRCRAMISRFAPRGSEYAKVLEKRNFSNTQIIGILQALHADYEAGYMVSLIETINADLFSDMLEAASHFLEEQKMKLVAAVMAGGVLEEHIRKLCEKNGIDTNGGDGKSLKASVLNAALKREDVYGKNEHKQVEAWQGVRNSAAHNKDDEYDATQVKTMIDGIRGFILKYPA